MVVFIEVFVFRKGLYRVRLFLFFFRISRARFSCREGFVGIACVGRGFFL